MQYAINTQKLESCVVCMGIFSITACVMSSKFIVEEYTGKRAILLLSYPINRERILNTKILLTFFYTTVSMLLCEGMTLDIFTVILVIVILLHRDLCCKVKKMEV